MSKHRLTGAMFYLAGAMDDVPDRGFEWRQDIKYFLWKKNIGVLDPCQKPLLNGTDEDEVYYNEINQLKESGDYQATHEKMRPVAAEDYRMVDKADALILYIDRDAHMCGSYHENCMAAYQRKPVIVCCKQGIKAIPNWIFSVCRHEMFFSTLADTKRYIDHVCFSKDVETYNRWRFFDNEKIYGRDILCEQM
jgi:hypothetical protein